MKWKMPVQMSHSCVDCRSCKNSLRFDALSIQEEIEQGFSERSIHVIRGITTAKLPFVTDADVRLLPNEKEALKVYRGR